MLRKIPAITTFIVLISLLACGDGIGPSTKIEEIWKFGIDGGICLGISVVDNKIYGAGYKGTVFCINTDAEIVWESDTGYLMLQGPSYGGGKIYAAASNTKIICLDANTGEHIWTYDTGYENIVTPANFSNYKIYVGISSTLTKKFLCLDANDGSVLWEFEPAYDPAGEAVVKEGKVYFATIYKYLYCLNAENGNVLWVYESGGFDPSTSVCLVDNSLYVGSDNGYIYCLNADTGFFKYRIELGGAPHSTPAVSDNMMYFGCDDDYVYGYDLQSYILKWKYITGGNVRSNPAAANGKVYIGSNDHYMYCLSKDGGFLWRFDLGRPCWASPIYYNSRIYFSFGYIYCLDAG